jgi:hypothetical protein
MLHMHVFHDRFGVVLSYIRKGRIAVKVIKFTFGTLFSIILVSDQIVGVLN